MLVYKETNMKSIFVSDKDKVEVLIYFAKDKKDEIFISNDKDGLTKQKGIKADTLEEYKIIFKTPNYGDSISIYKESVKIENGSMKIDPISLRSNKLINLLESWTFVDDNGKPVVVNQKNVLNLNAGLANLIIDELEKIVGEF